MLHFFKLMIWASLPCCVASRCSSRSLTAANTVSSTAVTRIWRHFSSRWVKHPDEGRVVVHFCLWETLHCHDVGKDLGWGWTYNRKYWCWYSMLWCQENYAQSLSVEYQSRIFHIIITSSHNSMGSFLETFLELFQHPDYHDSRYQTRRQLDGRSFALRLRPHPTCTFCYYNSRGDF